jgi:hypothetical protein
LGELTDELDPGDGIIRFCSTGPKSYAYETRKGKKVVKSKGVPVGSEGVDIELYEDMVTNAYSDPIKHKIKLALYFQRDCATSSINRTDREKTLQYTYDKRIVLDNYRTRPFGTKDV